MPPPADREDHAREHQIFWMLVKGSRDHPVGRVYLAIQAALAYGYEKVDVGWLMGEMMAQGRKTMGPSCDDIGGSELAYFHWLYEVELAATDSTDQYEYRFRRRSDGKTVLATLKMSADPRGLHFQQSHERERRKLEMKREKFLSGYRRQAELPPHNGVENMG